VHYNYTAFTGAVAAITQLLLLKSYIWRHLDALLLVVVAMLPATCLLLAVASSKFTILHNLLYTHTHKFSYKTTFH
jgi:hypothetical protein